MPVAATRVRLSPPEPWDEARLLDAARALPLAPGALRPGDEVNGLVVRAVEPAPDAVADRATAYDILPATPPDTTRVDTVLLLDASGTMGEPWSATLTRSGAARQAIASFIAEAGAEVATLSIYEFGKDLQRLAGPAHPGDLGALEFRKPKGPARLAAALDAALAEIARLPPRARILHVLTDGGDDPTALRAALTRARRLRTRVDVLVFAPEVDVQLQDAVRDQGGAAQVARDPPRIEFVPEVLL